MLSFVLFIGSAPGESSSHGIYLPWLLRSHHWCYCNGFIPNTREINMKYADKKGRHSPTTNQQRAVFVVHGPLVRCVKLRVAHAPGMLGTFSPPPWVSDPDMYHDTCVTHVPWCIPGSLASGFLWSRWRGKRSRHARRMRNLKVYISGKRCMGCKITEIWKRL